MFKSARIKLTLFYLAVLVAFSFVITFSIRILAEQEYLHSNRVQRGEVRQIILRLPTYGNFGRPTDDFTDFQLDQEAVVRQQLNQDMLLINIVALMISGILSYWFAGRTLKPIEETHEAQTRFAADASHELRTPLTNMKLENEVFLRQRHFSEQEARDLIGSNLEEVQRMENLSSNLLALTQYGNASLPIGGVPVKRIVDEAVRLTRPLTAKKKVLLKEKLAEEMVRGHHESLVQLLGILLDNAIKYGPEKGTVSIEGRTEGGQYLLSVQDEGPGIAPEDLPHIFKRLYRGDKARSNSNGYGLGLSLAQAIVAANGAEIRVQNTPTKGARFTLHIPLVK